jgi:cephalosporin hydroxylase
VNREETTSGIASLDRLASLTKLTIEHRLETKVHGYWLDRVAQHTRDCYAGVPFSKFPEDLRVYEHLMWAAEPNVVIEIGTQFGASALWFRDRLRMLMTYGRISSYGVISIDTETGPARMYLDHVDPCWPESITLVEGDVCDGGLARRIESLVPDGSSCFVVEDSAHTYATTMAALKGFSQFVQPGGFIIIEDGCVDIEAMRLDEEWPRGVLPAIQEWLADPAGADFRVRRDLELYGMTCHPSGILQREAR